MPEVIVKAGTGEKEEDVVVMREHVSDRNFESSHYADQLIERIGWAVTDAAAAEERSDG